MKYKEKQSTGKYMLIRLLLEQFHRHRKCIILIHSLKKNKFQEHNSIIDNDLARDNVENDLTAADLQDL